MVLILELDNGEATLRTGDISFISFKSTNEDGFAIITFVDLPPGTKIRFIDSEWNGNHFGFDENDVLWQTGDKLIEAGSVISFMDLNSEQSSVDHGKILGTMNLSSKKEAIFAYVGDERMPTKFLAACANNSIGYKTLINTDLVEGQTAITYPEGTTYARYIGPSYYQNSTKFREALNHMGNYFLQN